MDVLSYIIASRLLSCPGGNGANIKLDENGNIDVDKMKIITFDMLSNTYRILGEVVGKAF